MVGFYVTPSSASVTKWLARSFAGGRAVGKPVSRACDGRFIQMFSKRHVPRVWSLDTTMSSTVARFFFRGVPRGVYALCFLTGKHVDKWTPKDRISAKWAALRM